jgi:signal transduction histidine kinase
VIAVGPPARTVRTIDLEAFDCLPDGVLFVRRGRVAWASRRAADLLGTTPDGLSGRPMGTVFDERDLARLEELLSQREAAQGPSRLLRMRVCAEAGRPGRALDVRAAPAGGSLLPAAVLTLRDASSLGRTEHLLRELSKLATSTAGSDPDALLVGAEPIFFATRLAGAFWERRGDALRLVRLLSPRGEGGREAAIRLLGEDIPIARLPAAWGVVTSGQCRFVEVPRGTEGALARCLAGIGNAKSAWLPVLRGEHVTHVLTVVGAQLVERDSVAFQLLADRLAASYVESELRTALLERERLSTIGRVASEIAEELRDPARLRQVVDGLVHLADRIEARIEDVPLPELLLRTVACADDFGRHADEAVELETTAELPCVRADAGLLKGAIEILLFERLRHGPAHGRVAVRAEPEGESSVRISVEGAGPAATSGLRLAVVRHSIEEMGGRFTALSDERGASFSILLRAGGADPGAP